MQNSCHCKGDYWGKEAKQLGDFLHLHIKFHVLALTMLCGAFFQVLFGHHGRDIMPGHVQCFPAYATHGIAG